MGTRIQARAMAPLTEQLREQARAAQLPSAMPSRYRQLSAVDLYQEFLKARLDAKGAIATGYGSSGWGLDTDVGADAGSFLLPGVFSLSLEASAGAARARSVVLAIHRVMPQAIYALSNPTHVLWESDYPVTFLSLFGTSYSLNTKAGATIGVEQELPLLEEVAAEVAAAAAVSLTEIPLAIGVSATVSAQYQYDALYASDPFPGFYPNVTDRRLAADFEYQLLPDIKRAVITWINQFSDRVFKLNGEALRSFKQNPGQLQQEFLKQQAALLRKQPGTLRQMLSSVKSSLRGQLPTLSAIYDGLDRVLDRLEAREYTAAEMIGFIDNLNALIPTSETIRSYYILPSTQAGGPLFFPGNVDPNDLRPMQEAMGLMRAQLAQYRARLVALQAATPASAALQKGRAPLTELYNRLNCFLKIASHTAEGEASVAAGVIAGYARAGVSGKYKRAAYRYQTVSPDLRRRQSLIYTQDTSITYRIATANVEAGTAFYGQSIGRGLAHQGMTYQSACVYWIYEEAPQYSGRVRPRRGSGLSYGVSVRRDDLIGCIREIKRLDIKSPEGWSHIPDTLQSRKLIYLLAKYLRISFKYLIAFLYECAPDSLEGSIQVPAVLIESSFALPLVPSSPAGGDVLLEALPKVKPYRDPSGVRRLVDIYRLQSIRQCSHVVAFARQLDSMPNAFTNCQQYLQTIRLRGRMADYTESAVQFKLGVPAAGIDPVSVGITLTKITEAGHEGVIEVMQKHYKGENDDERVPPVALFHQ